MQLCEMMEPFNCRVWPQLFCSLCFRNQWRAATNVIKVPICDFKPPQTCKLHGSILHRNYKNPEITPPTFTIFSVTASYINLPYTPLLLLLCTDTCIARKSLPLADLGKANYWVKLLLNPVMWSKPCDFSVYFWYWMIKILGYGL